ncbi:MAG: L-2-amino-thiazoline-4-carboxylic acid hydrolase [Ectothiorhodospiraceae bacterium]|nr:L-2-amino-thiazoline-4-carboxylic acid hydrolase [Chromatiales bacterium]MCP5153711.1 L-2-amino-thiazoline-4-carboxylic acid hydrolase [Ectothiorhodospiraceae bacterium]
MKTDLPMFEQRRIEANVIKPIYEEMKARLGVDMASEIVGAAIRKAAIAQGEAYAAAQGGETSLAGFHGLMPQWTANGALEIEMLSQDDDEVAYNVVRCRYAEMYREMGLAEIGHLLSCGRDGTFCKGYDRRIDLTRTQTIMEGASHCDFRYRWNADS